MASHELGCTNNSQRICGLCPRLEQEQPKLEDLIENATQIDNLRKIAGGCPACMLTGVRHYNKLADSEDRAWIDYKIEHARYWEEVNDVGEYFSPVMGLPVGSYLVER